jgi:uncharacterized cysteine cluster protein YcgN (CxxCxxCC family)
MQDVDRYNEWMNVKMSAWEARCTRCGACCGALDDSCENLRKNADGKFYCTVFDQRFGPRHTLSGKEFTCVPIRQKIARGESWPGDEHCGYQLKQEG